MNAQKIYVCPECDEAHYEEQDAQLCCAKPIRAEYVCDNCDTRFSDKGDAEDCCAEDDEDDEGDSE